MGIFHCRTRVSKGYTVPVEIHEDGRHFPGGKFCRGRTGTAVAIGSPTATARGAIWVWKELFLRVHEHIIENDEHRHRNKKHMCIYPLA
jgi:hypothetical protein